MQRCADSCDKGQNAVLESDGNTVNERELNDMKAKHSMEHLEAEMVSDPRCEKRSAPYVNVAAAAAHCLDPSRLPVGLQNAGRQFLESLARHANVTPFEERTDR